MNKKALFSIGMMILFLTSIIVPTMGSETDTIEVTFEYYGPNWDVNHNGGSDYIDVSRICWKYNTTDDPGNDFREDIDRSGKVDHLDVSSFVPHYGEDWVVD